MVLTRQRTGGPVGPPWWRVFAAFVLAAVCLGWAAHAQRGPKVLLLYDMEGVTGAARPSDVASGSEGYPAARESLTEDVNAAIRGLIAAGAREVVLTDGHGSGSSEPDYMLDRLPHGARHDIRDQPYDPYLEAMDESYDAMVAVAMHGRAGGRAFLAHTYNGHTRWVMGGHDMNESMLVAASAARFGIPLILVTGDDLLKEEVAAFSPQTEYVIVKRAVSIETAEPRPRDVVSAEIEEAAARALRNMRNIPAWRPPVLRGPFENRFGYILPDQASIAILYPGASSVDDKTVSLETGSFVEAYRAFRALAAFTSLATPRLTLGRVRELAGGPELIRQAEAKLPSRAERTFEPTGPEVRRMFGPGRHGFR